MTLRQNHDWWVSPIILKEVDSTQEEVFRRGKVGMIVVADSQTKGRGRKGREWVSPPGNLYFSILLDENTAGLTLKAGLAIARTLESLGITPSIKWPNDILVEGRKIAGVLCENRDQLIAVGIGVNIERAPIKTAICLRDILGPLTPSRDEFLALLDFTWDDENFSEEVEKRLLRGPAFHEATPITIIGIAPSGALIASKNGRRVEIISGEVTFPPMKKS